MEFVSLIRLKHTRDANVLRYSQETSHAVLEIVTQPDVRLRLVEWSDSKDDESQQIITCP